MTHLPDADLVRRCLEREAGAWETLVDRYADLVYGIARRSGLDGARSEDLVQDVFLVLLKNLRRLRRHDRLMGWLVKAAKREAWRARRRDKASRAREEDRSRPESDPGPRPEDVLVSEEQRHLVRQAMLSIDARCRRLLDALFLRGEADYRQVGEELGMAVGSIGPTRKRCLEKLLGALEAHGIPPPPVSGVPPAASRGLDPDGSEKGTP